MKKIKHYLSRGRTYVCTYLAVLCMLFSVQEAWADNFMQNSANYTAIPIGIDKVRFTLPTQFDSNTQNEGILYGNINYTIDDDTRLEPLLTWGLGSGYNDFSGKNESGKITLVPYKGGTWQLVGKTKGGYKYFTSDVTFTVGPNDDDNDHYSTVVEWTIPYELRGHKFTFRLFCRIDDTTRHWFIPDGVETVNTVADTYNMGEFDCPAPPKVDVTLNDPMMAYSTDHPGTLMIPYNVQAAKVTKATIYYTDALTNETFTQELSSKLVDFAYLPIDRPWKDIYISVDIIDTGDNAVKGIKSKNISTNLMHFPQNLKAVVQPLGNVLLTWKIDNAQLDDFDDSDYFEIQRNVNGTTDANDDGWTTISMDQSLIKGKTEYSFTDNTLLDRYKNKPVAYRVRRTGTAPWRWAPGSGVSMSMVPTVLALPGIHEAHVQRTTWNDEKHTVKFDYKFGTKYDREGRFIVRNDADWEDAKAQMKEGKLAEENVVMTISNESDWSAFCQRIHYSYSRLNAVLMGDIDLTNNTKTVLMRYSGTFDGLGHTLTVNLSGTYEGVALFQEVSDATIKNLTVAGKITSSRKFAGGIIGYVDGSSSHTRIEHCEVKADIVLNIDGDASSGGLIGYMKKNTSVTIDNCAFTGSFLGDKATCNGGFIGVAGGECNINISHSLFAPVALPFNMTGCSTFARHDNSTTMVLDNCYYTKIYGQYEPGEKTYYVIQSGKDWELFCQLVENAPKGTEYNGILTTDITVSNMLGSDAKPFCGTFDGNGHTITANINTDQWAAAPFRIVGNVTIKNLHVAGSVVGGRHASGLIGSRDGTPDIHVEKVWVSANVTTKDRYLGGIIGHVGGANAYISDTRFDGKLIASADSYSAQSSFGGAIIGWGGEGTWFFHRVYDYSTRDNVYWYFYCIDSHTGDWQSWGGNSVSTNTVTWNSWTNDYLKHNIEDQNEVLSLMNGEEAGSWHMVDGMAVPVLPTVEVYKQGTSAAFMSTAELKTALGDDQWYESDGVLHPVQETSEDHAYCINIWDNRAKFMLYKKMKGENGVITEIVDMSGDENAIKNHTFTHDLTRKCVEYDFELVVKRGSSSMMIAGSAVDTLAKAVEKVEVDNPSYKFMNLNNITSVTYEKKQSSVRLAWEITGGESDFYRVLRRKHSNDENAEWTDTIATNLQQQFYEDKKMLIQQAYDYRVESVLQCEGIHITSAELKGAECEPTGRISGYVRMADGTAIAGIGVTCSPGEGVIGGITKTTKTDEAGFFEFSGLPYQGTGSYYITIDETGYKGPNELGEVNFSQNSNWTQGFNYYMDNYYIYSGNVFYRDTSIPVPGVSFKLDGNVMHDANKKVIITDTQGAFSLSIPAGSHRVQAVKDGHYFANDGYLINKDAIPGHERDYNFNTNVAGVYLWDSTTVVLRGRVIGGDDQGKLPLGESMSVNNLGDSIKIVMQLEGDNASYLIRKQDDETVKTADYQYTYGLDNRDTTNVHVTRHMITIRPDKNTGEYQLALHPAKYKVTEISAQGYATLFQDGKVGETLDLTFNVQGDTCEYNRIYHSVPTVDVKQFNIGDEPYFGVKKVTANDILGNKSVINTWYWKQLENKDSVGVYSFGYPVFMSGSPYGWMLQACEKYHYNNNPNNDPDIVKLKGGKVTIKNGMVSVTDSQELTLDDEGGASYIFTPKNTTPVMTGESALMNVSITLEYDNTFYDIKPMKGKIFQGYVMATVAKPEGRKSISTSIPQLIDILRDPPGATSSAYLEEGSKLSYSYNAEMAGAAGLTFHLVKGSANNTYTGGVVVPATGQGTTAGTYINSQKKDALKLDAITYYNQGWTFSYNFDVTQRIQTLSGKKWIGARADVFIGMTTEVIVEDAIALRVVPDSMYQIYKTNEGGSFKVTDSEGNSATFKVPTGTARVLVEGVDDTGQPVYLIRDEVMAVGPRLQSTFAHSQYYIENELIPDLLKLRNSLILPMGTDSLYAQQLANKRGYCSYISKVPENDLCFGHKGYYDRYAPEGSLAGDSIMTLNATIESWLLMLAENERQKLSVQESNLVKRYDFDGAANIQYSETFSNVQTETRSLRYPGINDAGQVADGIMTGIKVFIDAAIKALQGEGNGVSNKPNYTYDVNAGGEWKSVSIVGGGAYIDLNFEPLFSLNFTDKSGMSKTDSKKIGFTLAASSKSSLTVDVYRTAIEQTLDNSTAFNNMTLEMLDMLRYGKLGSNPTDYLSNRETVYSNFVYRTRGGVTCGPYEKEYVSKWYMPGTVIDAATIPADKPKIWVEEPVVSNVPFDEPARFILHMANESDYPERASLVFNYFLLANSNPKGAKLFVEGAPINSQGVSITLYPCRDNKNEVTVFTKELELYPSQDFDYENLVLGLYDPEDANRVFNCTISAHFIPAAGKVNISTPSDKWVVNTESSYDGKRQAWYLPVKIDGFDTNYRGFDHIELQYKLSTQGEKDWVSVCSYYADEALRAKASGVTDTIPANGAIIAPFYGEIDPIEQYYDIRAVNYCRHGNGFLTRSSEVLTGIKDTRLPVAFGTPEPTNGILGIGDDIVVKFSEPIAGNYLRKINNFEMLGTKNSNDLTTSTSLTFSGNSYAMTQGDRNLAGKSFTVDVMLDPADDAVPMDVFSHGGMERGLIFGLTADRKLSATINGKTIESDQAVPFNHVLRQVAYTLDQSGDGMTVSFFDQNKLIGKQELADKYEGSSPMMVGYSYDAQNNYKGDMLELRLWNRVLTGNELDTYGRKQLTGYETGLLDYYPLNEGENDWGYDKAPSSMDLMLIGTSWKRPTGLSIALKGDKGLLLDPNQFYRRDIHDYTLMFWFRTNDDNATLFSNGEALRGQSDKINIGIKDYNLYVRSSGFERITDAIVNEGSWHHFAMTVSRPQNVANIYIDKNLVDSFAADSLSGIKGDSIALGATFVDLNTQTNVMHGNIDEVAMFESVLPLNLIKEYSNHTPLGTTVPLMAYLSFEQSKKSDDNTQELVPTGVSLKLYVDNQNKVQARRDSLVSDEKVKALSDKEFYAPMLSTAQLENINYNFVSNDNQLYISINEPDYMVEKTNVYVTVKEVPDLQGNLMASPITLNLFVYRNPLRWNVKRIEKEVKYGEGVTIEATVKNLSGVTQNYSLEDLPVWISASHTSGTIAALDEQVIKFTVSPYINIGTYNEQISLIGDSKMTEPLPITLTVRGDEPEWAVSDQLKQLNQTMMMVARVKIDGVVASLKDDVLAVFDDYQQTLGVAHVELNQKNNANEALAYLTIYGYTNPDGSHPKLNFRFYKANTGSVYKVEPSDGTVYTFTKDALVGSADNPVILEDDPWHAIWWINLKKGWNWVSIPVTTKNQTVGEFLDGLTKWEIGDKIMAVKGTTKQEYTCRQNKILPRGYKWDNEDQPINIDPTQMYNIYSKSDKTIYLEGTHYYSSIALHKDWNRIAYTPTINLPIAQALADYTEKAQEGDVVKSQDGFVVASRSNTGLIWKGTLQYMEVGKGYMLKRQADSNVEFTYPLYFSDNKYGGDNVSMVKRFVSTATTMNVVAAVEGIETEAGDRLVVYCGAERMAEATGDEDQNYYLNIGSDANNGETLTFAIERDGETIAMTGSHISYAANKVIGTPEEPTAINFTALDEMPHDGKWYTTSGIMLQEKPTRAGMYIFNGQVQIIKP